MQKRKNPWRTLELISFAPPAHKGKTAQVNVAAFTRKLITVTKEVIRRMSNGK
jgi:hypothetical protein